MKHLKGIISLSAISIAIGTLISIPCGFGVGTLTAVGIGTVASVCNYVFFSKPKNLKHDINPESKPFLNVEGSDEKNPSPSYIFESLHKMQSKPTFKGSHTRQTDNSNNNDLSL